MNRLKATLVSLLLFSVSNVCVAKAERVRVENLNHCSVSESAMNDYEPEFFEKINNLLRKTGEEALFCGESIVVYGKVIDENCVPVADAKIYAWQTDCKGKYPYKALKNKVVDKKLMSKNHSLTFVGNGTATTNNKGEFHFVTVYPPSMHGYGPHLNIKVEHSSTKGLQTRLIFKNKKVKNPCGDRDLMSISREADKKGMKVYKFEIVVPGVVNKDY